MQSAQADKFIISTDRVVIVTPEIDLAI